MRILYDEGDVGIKNIEDICMAFQQKQWQSFRTKHTFWEEFMKGRYCQRSKQNCKKRAEETQFLETRATNKGDDGETHEMET